MLLSRTFRLRLLNHPLELRPANHFAYILHKQSSDCKINDIETIGQGQRLHQRRITFEIDVLVEL